MRVWVLWDGGDPSSISGEERVGRIWEAQIKESVRLRGESRFSLTAYDIPAPGEEEKGDEKGSERR